MTTSALKQWADAVKARDGKCLKCGTTEDLHAHHVLPKSTHPELSLDPDNGMTLCYRCHKAEHEKSRHVRIRTNRPQRRTLEAKIAELTEELTTLRTQMRKMRSLVAECERGVCQSSLKRKRVLAALG